MKEEASIALFSVWKTMTVPESVVKVVSTMMKSVDVVTVELTLQVCLKLYVAFGSVLWTGRKPVGGGMVMVLGTPTVVASIVPVEPS